MRLCVRIALGVLVAQPFPVPGQAPRPLGKPDAEHSHAFTRVTTMRELKHGRVLVVDEREDALFLIDFQSGTATVVGRRGAGPGEYGYPGRIVALPGDTSLLQDPPNARFLLINPDGTPGETFRLGEAVATRLGVRGSIPRASDARGNLYFEGLPTAGRGGVMPVALDSTPVTRYDRRTMQLDTIAFVQLAKGNVRVRPGPTRGFSVRTGALAYPLRDDWAALPDGGVAVVRARDYHIDRYSSKGVLTAGPPVITTPVPVTETEKEAWREERRGRAVSRSDGGVVQNVSEPDWPATMPPFVYWATFAQPNGDVWVLRSHKASDAPVYDIFNASGVRAARIVMPARTRLIGFGNGTLYLVRLDDDGFEHFQRYKLPI